MSVPVDAEVGQPDELDVAPTLGQEPRNFTIDPTGKWLLVANQESDSVVIFQVNPTTGMIRPTGQTLHVPKPTCLKMIKYSHI